MVNDGNYKIYHIIYIMDPVCMSLYVNLSFDNKFHQQL